MREKARLTEEALNSIDVDAANRRETLLWLTFLLSLLNLKSHA